MATGEQSDGAFVEAVRRVDAEARAVLSGLQPAESKTLRAVAAYGGSLNARALRTLDLAKTIAAEASRKLLGEGLLEREGDGWRVVDPLLGRWIRQELGTRTPAPTTCRPRRPSTPQGASTCGAVEEPHRTPQAIKTVDDVRTQLDRKLSTHWNSWLTGGSATHPAAGLGGTSRSGCPDRRGRVDEDRLEPRARMHG